MKIDDTALRCFSLGLVEAKEKEPGVLQWRRGGECQEAAPSWLSVAGRLYIEPDSSFLLSCSQFVSVFFCALFFFFFFKGALSSVRYTERDRSKSREDPEWRNMSRPSFLSSSTYLSLFAFFHSLLHRAALILFCVRDEEENAPLVSDDDPKGAKTAQHLPHPAPLLAALSSYLYTTTPSRSRGLFCFPLLAASDVVCASSYTI